MNHARLVPRIDVVRRQRAPAAFTLLELLVVISIIMVLISLLLPSFRGARESAWNIECQNNQKQVYLGLAAYAQDFREYIPPSGNGDLAWKNWIGRGGYWGPPHEHKSWNFFPWRATAPRWTVLRCPADPVHDYGAGAGQANGYNNDFMLSSYAYNWSATGYAYWSPRRSLYDPRMTTPAKGLLVMDNRKWVYGWDLAYFAWDIDAVSEYSANAFRHPGRYANAMFMDGHVEQRRHFSESGESNWVWLWNYTDTSGF